MTRSNKPNSSERTYLRPRGQDQVPTPGAGRTDGRLRQGDPMIPTGSTTKTGR